MIDRSYDTSDDIAALATPLSESALAIIRTSGPGCLERLDKLFRPVEREGPPLSRTTGHRLRVGELVDPEKGGVLDQVVAAVYRKPAGYCGEDGVEFFCHGNPPALKVILEVLEKAGFRGAERGEFTYRAFLNGKMDLTRAEAVNEIVTAKTFTAQQLALDRLSGAVHRRVFEARRQLILASAAVELWLDYPEDEFEEGRAADPRHAVEAAAVVLSELSDSYRVGRIYQEGVSVVLAGPTNAGKSALFNHLVKQERSIVSPHHGTTRDYIEATVNLGGIPVRLVDTAGIRDTEHPVEVEGIRRSRRELEEAALVIYLVDAAEGLSEADRRVLEAERERIIPLWNKVDLAAGTPPEGFLSVSAWRGDGIGELIDLLLERLTGGLNSAGPEGAVIDSARQKALIDSALDSLHLVLEGMDGGVPLDAVSLDLDEARSALGRLTGEISTSDILETMFDQFCVGK